MNPRIEIRHLRYFVAVAEELHFGRAAQRLGLAQPPLSQQIRQFEEMLGFPLFIRTSRSVQLTQAGQSYLERARRLLLSLDRDIDEARQIAAGKLGTLHLGFVGSAMLTNLPSVIREFQATHPRLELRLSESFTSRVMQGLDDEVLDFGILRDADPADSLHIETLLEEPFVALLPTHHPLARKRNISPGDLKNDPFVFYPPLAGTRAFEKSMSLCEAHGFRPRISQFASHWLSILRLIIAGMGVSIAPACVRRIASEGTVCVPLRGVSIFSDIQIAWRKDDHRPMIQNFATFIRERQSRRTRRMNDRAETLNDVEPKKSARKLDSAGSQS